MRCAILIILTTIPASCSTLAPPLQAPQGLDATSPVVPLNPAIVLFDGAAPTPAPAPVPTQPLTLAACLELALNQHPDLAVAAAQVDAARGTLLQAGLYPNPTLSYSGQEMNSPGGGAGQQGIMLAQNFVTGNKLGLATAAAAREVEAADWRTRARLFDVVTRVRSAFYEALAARQEVEAAREILRLAQNGLDTAEKLKEGRVVEQPDVLRARVELEQSRIKVSLAEQRAAAALRLLAVSLGQPDLAIPSVDGALTSTVPEYDLPSLRQAALDASPELKANLAEVHHAQASLARAEAEVVPDLQFQVNPFYSHPDDRAMLSLTVGATLPFFNRNQGNIASARAAIVRAHATLRQTELQLTERLTLAFQRYQNARTQVTTFEKDIIPAALESVRLLSIAYGQGDPRYDFTALLEGQRSLAQARLGLVQARGELQKAVSDLEGLLQRMP